MDPSSANRREVLGDALFMIRFPLLTPLQFTDAAKNGLLTKEEISSIVTYHNATMKPSLLFSAEYRTGTQALKPLTLGYGEDVFVRTRTKEGILCWKPTRITGFNSGQLWFVWCNRE
ncbi:BTB/POZ domain-containing protein 6-B-like [Paramacrobiotus metropolitanus]|uniref:BTB/POZ domain-containing protein 6-B-like n=1 Tax=Paramacrobiotus metropolitanus TaxID=2943436 RepID=UPI002445976D|nr:BTB/POZ domain-containing protein 6-B-like [Paramacrobiotus metropolitanus]